MKASMLDQIRAIKDASEQSTASEREMANSLLDQLRALRKGLERPAQEVGNKPLTAEDLSNSSDRTAEGSTEPELEAQAARQEEATITERAREGAAIQEPAVETPASAPLPIGEQHDEVPDGLEAGKLRADSKTRRTPDLETSRKRLALLERLATELATIKDRTTERFCDAPILKREFPNFELWKHISQEEIRELTNGEDFSPRAYAGRIALRVSGVNSPETLKKDRRKLKRASNAK